LLFEVRRKHPVPSQRSAPRRFVFHTASPAKKKKKKQKKKKKKKKNKQPPSHQHPADSAREGRLLEIRPPLSPTHRPTRRQPATAPGRGVQLLPFPPARRSHSPRAKTPARGGLFLAAFALKSSRFSRRSRVFLSPSGSLVAILRRASPILFERPGTSGPPPLVGDQIGDAKVPGRSKGLQTRSKHPDPPRCRQSQRSRRFFGGRQSRAKPVRPTGDSPSPRVSVIPSF